MLSEGTHEFDFHLCSSFFEQYESLSEYTGSIEVRVVLCKQDRKKQLRIKLQGDLKTTCDRCLETMDLLFETEGSYYIREAESGEEEKEDTVFVDAEDTEVELSHLFYEMLMTGLPQKKMHKKKDCNVEMLQKLEALNIKKERIDPRWEELQKLMKK